MSVAQYGVTSKNLAVFDNVANGTFVRKNLSRDSVETARQAVLHGTHTDEINAFAVEFGESASETDLNAFDTIVMES